MTQVTIYSRPGCHLCQRVEQLVERAHAEANFESRTINIDSDPTLRARYDWEIPIVAINGKDMFGYAMVYEAFLAKIKELQ